METPEQVHLEFAIAGIGSRFLALALDTLLQFGISLVIFLLGLIAWFSFLQNWRIAMPWLAAAGILAWFLVYFGYFALFEILWNGQTPGKRTVGIRVIRDSGGPLSPAESIGRNLMRIVDQIPAFYAVGIVTAMCNAQSKRLGDLVVGSIVVRENALTDTAPLWVNPPAAASSALGGRRLSPEDVHLINAFLMRRADLSGDVRRRTADDILRKLKPKLDLSGEDLYRREATLESLAHEHRSGGR